MTLSPFEDPDSAALSLLSPPSEWRKKEGSHMTLNCSSPEPHDIVPLPISPHPNLASCFQPPKCSALRLAWPGTSIPMLLSYLQPHNVAPEAGRNSIHSPLGCCSRLRQLPLQLIPLRALPAISVLITHTDWPLSSSFVFRENRVPYYQRLFQNHDGKRQWWKVSVIRR